MIAAFDHPTSHNQGTSANQPVEHGGRGVGTPSQRGRFTWGGIFFFPTGVPGCGCLYSKKRAGLSAVWNVTLEFPRLSIRRNPKKGRQSGPSIARSPSGWPLPRIHIRFFRVARSEIHQRFSEARWHRKSDNLLEISGLL